MDCSRLPGVQGAQAAAFDGPKIATTGMPAAAARCIGSESLPMKSAHWASVAASCFGVVAPAALVAHAGAPSSQDRLVQLAFLRAADQDERGVCFLMKGRG